MYGIAFVWTLSLLLGFFYSWASIGYAFIYSLPFLVVYSGLTWVVLRLRVKVGALSFRVQIGLTKPKNLDLLRTLLGFCSWVRIALWIIAAFAPILFAVRGVSEVM